MTPELEKVRQDLETEAAERDAMNPDRPPEPGADPFSPETGRFRQAIGENMNWRVDQMRDHLNMTAPDARAMVDQDTKLLTGVVNPTDATRVHDLIVKHRIQPANDEERLAWAPEASRAVHEAYGEDADQVMADARRLVEQRPDLQKLLNETGLGSHPTVVKAIVDMARRRRGRRPL